MAYPTTVSQLGLKLPGVKLRIAIRQCKSRHQVSRSVLREVPQSACYSERLLVHAVTAHICEVLVHAWVHVHVRSLYNALVQKTEFMLFD